MIIIKKWTRKDSCGRNRSMNWHLLKINGQKHFLEFHDIKFCFNYIVWIPFFLNLSNFMLDLTGNWQVFQSKSRKVVNIVINGFYVSR